MSTFFSVRKCVGKANDKNPELEKRLLFRSVLRREVKKNKQAPQSRCQSPLLSLSGRILKKDLLFNKPGGRVKLQINERIETDSTGKDNIPPGYHIYLPRFLNQL